ncbi:unnamed protein product [Ostreobium quekettii]|uniref:SEC7 domain-containing protein n=1 Tax=Ostreobium quekettii TaxID=121088 RepID=A0A8S1J846_9CHLO|nr:unnamed protein product [Ostreobium quekettii]|eukprot:evm.model.scf_211.2 EVM.evm.TU.scf_211.2   scf_211:12105-31443(+)
MGTPLRELIASTLEKVYNACNTRKLTKLKQDCKSLLDRLDDVLSQKEGAAGGAVVVAADVALEPPELPEAPPTPTRIPPPQVGTENEDAPSEPADASGREPEEPPLPPAPSFQPEGVPDVAKRPQGDPQPPATGLVTGTNGEAEGVGTEEGEGPNFQAALAKLKVRGSVSGTPADEEGLTPEGYVEVKEAAEGVSSEGFANQDGKDQQQPAEVLTESAAAEIFPVFQLAMDMKKANLADILLDCLQRLIAHRHVQGVVTSVSTSLKSTRDAGAGEMEEESEAGSVILEAGKVPHQAQVIDMICKCDDVQDDTVELKLLKALLTAVTSTTFCVHGQGLLLAVRMCYNVYLMSRSQVNQTTAKASLTQMLNVVFQRMEANSLNVPIAPIVVSDVLGLPKVATTESASLSNFVQTFVNKAVADTLFAPSSEDVKLTVAGAFERRAVGGSETASDSDQDHIEWRESESQPGHSRVTSAEQQPVSPVIQAGVEHSAEALFQPTGDARSTVLQKDAFLVFRALCKLSIRTSPDSSVLDSTAVRGKVLALELIKVLLENSGPVFSSSERFVGAIKQYLCLSLLKNCASSIPQALHLSCSIFLTLVSKFRESLKAEIAVFFPMILLKSIEPQIGNPAAASGAQQPANTVTTSHAHQIVVLRCLQAHCSDGQLLVDLFVNYDCDLDNANVFERLVMALKGKALGHGMEKDAEKVSQQEALLRLESLRCLVNIVSALVTWHQAQQPGEMVNRESTAEGSDEDDEGESQFGGRSSRLLNTTSSAAPSSPRKSSYANIADAEDTGGASQESLVEKRAFKKRFQKGISLFNKHPKRGVEYMVQEALIGDSPAEIAAFLEKTEGLDKTMIGEYLGNRDEACVKVMHAYVDSLDFSSSELDQALRSFLMVFRLPGEAQKIDRLMEKFAERYLKCNPGSFKSADVAYILSYSMIMLNTDLHNPQVKEKMTKEAFLKNNRGINDGGDLPKELLEAIYERILANEIKMRDDSLIEGTAEGAAEGTAAEYLLNQKGVVWLDMFLGLIGRRQATLNEPSDEAIKRTQEYLREKAKGATFFKSVEVDTVRPMLEMTWAPMLGAFSVLFEQSEDEYTISLCLEGYVSAISITAKLGMAMLRSSFTRSLCHFTFLHAPASMRVKNALAFRAILDVAEVVGDNLNENWMDILKCVSLWELMYQHYSGTPTDASLFAPVSEVLNATEHLGPTVRLRQKLKQLSMRLGTDTDVATALAGPAAVDSFTEVSGKKLVGRKDSFAYAQILRQVDIQALNRLFVNSEQLDSEAIVDFVSALCNVSREELKSVQSPRVFSLTKIVEIAHFNMGRIRLVWSRIWSVLSDYFIQVGCSSNLSVAMYAVDSLRQLSMKFLERDELANYTFQNDFLKPFVVVMRQSKAVEIRELIIRCVSQMVLARVNNVKSGWKSMFMVFTTAAGDEQPNIVRLAFETIEKIVREHFNYITETETTTFTDCVNCLIGFTNNPHSLDVALNSIAFLRFCALKLAEGSIGDVEGELPKDLPPAATSPTRIVPAKTADMEELAQHRQPFLQSTASTAETGEGDAENPLQSMGSSSFRSLPRGIHFTDKDEHVYFWFPLLAGLSELTFDPRKEIRSSALEVLFDTLKFHGHSFARSFWARIIDSVLLPIFDHVRAEVTDTTTFTHDKLRAQIDAWLYETCIKCLQHLVDLFLKFYGALHTMMDRLLSLLSGFMHRTHQSLASMGVAALLRLVTNVGHLMSKDEWHQVLTVLETTARETEPAVVSLVTPPTPTEHQRHINRKSSDLTTTLEGAPSARGGWTLRQGKGARRLAEVRCRDAIQLLLVQATGEIYSHHCKLLDGDLTAYLLRTLRTIASRSRATDCDTGLRQCLAVQQAEDAIPGDFVLTDPPLLRLESEASHTYLSILLHLNMEGDVEIKKSCDVETQLVDLCVANLERFVAGSTRRQQEEVASASPREPMSPSGLGRVVTQTTDGHPVVLASTAAEYSMYSPLVVATLRAIGSFPDAMFREHLQRFFPLLTGLISCEHAPLDVQQALSDVFAKRIGPMM